MSLTVSPDDTSLTGTFLSPAPDASATAQGAAESPTVGQSSDGSPFDPRAYNSHRHLKMPLRGREMSRDSIATDASSQERGSAYPRVGSANGALCRERRSKVPREFRNDLRSILQSVRNLRPSSNTRLPPGDEQPPRDQPEEEPNQNRRASRSPRARRVSIASPERHPIDSPQSTLNSERLDTASQGEHGRATNAQVPNEQVQDQFSTPLSIDAMLSGSAPTMAATAAKDPSCCSGPCGVVQFPPLACYAFSKAVSILG